MSGRTTARYANAFMKNVSPKATQRTVYYRSVAAIFVCKICRIGIKIINSVVYNGIIVSFVSTSSTLECCLGGIVRVFGFK